MWSLAAAGEAASFNEKAAHVAGAVYGRDHPVLESYWRAVAESKQQASACPFMQGARGMHAPRGGSAAARANELPFKCTAACTCRWTCGCHAGTPDRAKPATVRPSVAEEEGVTCTVQKGLARWPVIHAF